MGLERVNKLKWRFGPYLLSQSGNIEISDLPMLTNVQKMMKLQGKIHELRLKICQLQRKIDGMDDPMERIKLESEITLMQNQVAFLVDKLKHNGRPIGSAVNLDLTISGE